MPPYPRIAASRGWALGRTAGDEVTAGWSSLQGDFGDQAKYRRSPSVCQNFEIADHPVLPGLDAVLVAVHSVVRVSGPCTRLGHLRVRQRAGILHLSLQYRRISLDIQNSVGILLQRSWAISFGVPIASFNQGQQAREGRACMGLAVHGRRTWGSAVSQLCIHWHSRSFRTR